MIAKGKSVSHTQASVDYALDKEKGGYILDKNIVGEEGQEVTDEFKTFQDLNSRCKKNTLSFVISPTIEDGEKLDREGLKAIQDSFLDKMKLHDHQYISIVHDNKAHKHIHLYVNRISKEGIAYKDNYISNRASEKGEIIANEFNLMTAKEQKRVKTLEREIKNPSITRIKELSKEVLKDKKIDSIEKFRVAFNSAGESENFRAVPYENKQGKFQGFRFHTEKESFKASEVDRELSQQNLTMALEAQAELNKTMELAISQGQEREGRSWGMSM